MLETIVTCIVLAGVVLLFFGAITFDLMAKFWEWISRD